MTQSQSIVRDALCAFRKSRFDNVAYWSRKANSSHDGTGFCYSMELAARADLAKVERACAEFGLYSKTESLVQRYSGYFCR